MNVPYISNGGRDEGLHGGHAESLDGARRRQRAEGLGLGGPEARHHQADRRGEVDGSLADLDGERIAQKAGDGDGDDAGALQADGELRERHAKLCRQGGEGGCQERADGYELLVMNVTQALVIQKGEVFFSETNRLHSRIHILWLLYT